MMRHRIAWSTLVLALSVTPWALVHVGCSKGEVEDQTFPPAPDGGTGGTEAGSFDVLTEVPTSTNCDDPTDSDGDFVADELEGAPDLDTDGDSTPDYLDEDSDGDGVSDETEAANPFLEGNQAGKVRDEPCATLADSDGDGIPDLRDVDSDGDGVADEDEGEYDPDGSQGCRVKPDCDGDDVVDPVELAAGSDVLDPSSVPPDATLYFVLPYEAPEKTKDFEFSAGVKKADVYFLIDTTESMQAAIDNVSSSLDSTILPAILNGDPAANPPIPAIPYTIILPLRPVCLSRSWIIAAPIGATTILNIDIIAPTNSKFFSTPVFNVVSQKGVIKGANAVAQAVSVIDSARLMRAMCAITFEASPLEHEPISTSPAPISGGNLSTLARPKPTSGMIVNWQIRPTPTACGILATPVKSRILICVPMPNITSWMMINTAQGWFILIETFSVICGLRNACGNSNGHTTAATIHAVN